MRIGKKESKTFCTYNRKKSRVFERKRRKPRAREKNQGRV